MGRTWLIFVHVQNLRGEDVAELGQMGRCSLDVTQTWHELLWRCTGVVRAGCRKYIPFSLLCHCVRATSFEFSLRCHCVHATSFEFSLSLRSCYVLWVLTAFLLRPLSSRCHCVRATSFEISLRCHCVLATSFEFSLSLRSCYVLWVLTAFLLCPLSSHCVHTMSFECSRHLLYTCATTAAHLYHVRGQHYCIYRAVYIFLIHCTVDSRYLKLQGTLWNISRYP